MWSILIDGKTIAKGTWDEVLGSLWEYASDPLGLIPFGEEEPSSDMDIYSMKGRKVGYALRRRD